MNTDRIYYSREAEMHAQRERTMLTLLCIMFGLGIGAVMALLFAPATGKNTRKDFAKNMNEGLKDGRESIEPLVKRLEEELKDVRKSIEERLKHN
jgi:gas vesicle protein